MSLRSMNGTRTMNLVGGATGGGVNPSLVYDFLVSANPIVPFGLTTTTTISANGTHVNSAGLVTQNTANVWPLDYSPSTLQPLGRPVWEARTNLLLRSQELDTGAVWVPTASTVTANAIVSPDGTQNAEKLNETTTTAAFFITQTLTKAASAITYTVSVYAKAGERNWILIANRDAAGNFARFWFNINTGVVGSTTTGGAAPFTSTFSSIQAAGNGWYRCICTFTSSTGTSLLADLIIANADLAVSYAGTAGNGIYVFGAQTEAGSFPTPYIPTAGTSVARSADACSIALPSSFNATEGTWVVEFIYGGNTNGFPHIASAEADASNRISNLMSNTNGFFGVSRVAASNVGSVTTANTLAANTIGRAAFGYKANDFAASLNGGAVVTDPSGALPASLTTLFLGSQGNAASWLNGWLRKLYYYPARLPDATLQLYSL